MGQFDAAGGARGVGVRHTTTTGMSSLGPIPISMIIIPVITTIRFPIPVVVTVCDGIVHIIVGAVVVVRGGS